MASVGLTVTPFTIFPTSLMGKPNKPLPQYPNQGYLPNGASSGPTPGAQALLPNNGRVIQSGPTRILCVADVRGVLDIQPSRAPLTHFAGNLRSLNVLAKQARADCILHTGDFGFYDDTSLDRIADK